jgi:hypothetical protein
MDRVSALTTLEEQVIRMLLAGDDAILSSLRDQAEHLTVSSREMTGVGFFTELVVTGSAATAAIARSFRLGDVSGTADGVMHGLGFLLLVEDGLLRMLKGYTYDEPWPAEVRNMRLSYSNERGHDLEMLRSLKH